VDTLIEVYRRGYCLDEVQLMCALGALGKLTPILQDILLAWAAVVVMALQEVGVERYPEVRYGRDRLRRALRARPYALPPLTARVLRRGRRACSGGAWPPAAPRRPPRTAWRAGCRAW
jgi:hypothetical protein